MRIGLTKLSSKLGLAYGLLFALVLAFSGIFVYTQVETVVNNTVNNSLDSTSDLIKRIVEVSIENKRGETVKDMIVAEHFIGEGIALDPERLVDISVYNPVNETRESLRIPEMTIGGRSILTDHWLVDQIHLSTGGTVAFFQMTDSGLVCVSSSDRNTPGLNGIGWLIHEDQSNYTLIMRNGTWFSRDYDYYGKQWFFTGFKLIESEDQVIGAIYVAQKQTQLDRLRQDILSIPVGQEGFPFIIDYVGKVVVHPDLEGKHLMHHEYMLDLVFQRNGRIQYQQRDDRTGRLTEHVAFFKYIEEMNWIVIVGSTKYDFFGSLYAVRLMMLIVFGTAILTSQILSLFLGRQITKPIVHITEKIREISEGEANLSRTLDIRTNDEVGRLSEYFNTFVKKLKNINDLERHGVEVMLRDTQMNALQAQINPHFLYNTLETIRFMISMKDQRAVEMVKLLAKLFRVSIGKGEKYVTVRSELEHVELYLGIQKIRYSDRFTIEIDIAEEILDLYTVKFLLQPLVENSIHHGFAEIEGGGLIRISAFRRNDRLVLELYDNGCGISARELQAIRQRLSRAEQCASVGLQNVYDRIQLHFGAQYSLNIDSRPGEWTRTTLNLPWLTLRPKTTYISENKRPVFIY